MQITKVDVVWNYGATFLKIAASALLLPFILRMMPPAMVGIWSIFMTITAFTSLLDFGFNSSFARNVTYIFSGVKTLKVNGYENVYENNLTVDYGLLKGVITAMKWFYTRVAILLFLLLTTLGTYYIYTLLQNYKSDHNEVYISWVILCIINSYNLFTLYYDSLLQGKGLVKKSKQVIIVGQTVYLVIGAILILAGNGLIAIVSAQAASVIIVRWLSHHYFFTKEIKQKLYNAITIPKAEILKAITPNAVKIGLTSLGGFMVQRSAIVIGSLYLPLQDIASYGITMQLIAVIAGLGGIYIATYQPKIAQLRVKENKLKIRELYFKGEIILFTTYIVSGICLLLFGELALKIIGSKTLLLPNLLLGLILITSFLETNLSIAGTILLSKNIVPFFKASLISGGSIIVGLLLLFQFTNGGLLIMICVPLFVDIAYQAWKWPLEVIYDLNINLSIKQKRYE
jgi:O-antigen/teichoic acid export membrane protein